MGSTNRNHKTGGFRITAVERQLRALELRKQGHTFPEIAEAVGYATASGAHKAVVKALRNTLREPAAEVRALYLERLDLVLQAMAPRMLEGNSGAALAYLKALERQAALQGLDAPARQEVNLNTERIAKDLARRTGLPVDEVIAAMPAVEGLGS